MYYLHLTPICGRHAAYGILRRWFPLFPTLNALLQTPQNPSFLPLTGCNHVLKVLFSRHFGWNLHVPIFSRFRPWFRPVHRCTTDPRHLRITALLLRPEAITKLVPRIYHTNVHILRQQIQMIIYEGYIQINLYKILFKTIKKFNASKNQI